MHKNIDWLRNRPIAHRGLHSDAHPENSLAAFREAIAQDLPIELDVYMTADGHIVVFHDADLMRMTGAEGKIEDATLSTVKTLRLHNTDQTIPTLQEVLDLVGGKVPLLIEIKNTDEHETVVAKVCALLTNYSGAFAIQAFNPFTLRWLKTHKPHIVRGQLSGSFKDEKIHVLKKILLRFMFFNWLTKPDFVAYELAALSCLGAKLLKTRRRPLIVWTVRSAADKQRAEKLRVNYIFDQTT